MQRRFVYCLQSLIEQYYYVMIHDTLFCLLSWEQRAYCSLRNETKRNETKRNETNQNETNQNETKQNETNLNETKQNETK